MTLWNLPESAQLEAQSLDKLALALAGGTGVQYSVSGVQYSDTNREVTGAGDAPTANGQRAGNSSTSPPVGQPTDPVIQESNSPTAQPSVGALAGPAGLLRPLVEDLLQEEGYLELRQATNQAAEVALAIRLEHPRANLWDSNLVC